jgi:Arc/MetJ family transcription regulator
MLIKIALDERLIKRAQEITGIQSEEEAVQEALYPCTNRLDLRILKVKHAPRIQWLRVWSAALPKTRIYGRN